MTPLRQQMSAPACSTPTPWSPDLRLGLGCGSLLANEQSDTNREDPVPVLERALASSACKDLYLRTSALGNLALAAIQRGEPAVARSHLARARENGLTPDELIEAITHLAFYAGWPNAVTAVGVAREVLRQD